MKKKSSMQQEIQKKLKRKLKTFKASFEKMKSQRVTIDDLKQLEEKALQLQNHLYLVQEGMESLQLGPEQGLDEDLIIELDPERAPGLNLKDYFIRLSKKKKSFQINEKRFAEVEQNIRNLDELRTKLDQEILSIHSLEKISENWSLGKVQNSQKNKTLERLPYKTFIDEQGVKYFVGKTAKDSDALVKKAKSHDLWFHVVGSTGSHVIVPFAFIKKLKSREEVQKNAAILALYYSKKKNDSAGEVYHAPRGMISKKKGQAPGLWTVDKARSFYVSYDEGELKKVLNLMT